MLISLDTVRADHLGAYGYHRPTSPNVDKLARRSIVFEDAISQSSWTLPAHGSMLSGVYPGRLGITHYPAKRRLPRGVPMLAEAFRRAGYATGGFTGGGFVSAHFGFGRGFDVYSSDGRRFEHNLGKALPWLKRHKSRPFFLFLHGYNAHRPYYSLAADKEAMGLPEDSQMERRGFCPRGERTRPDDLETIIRYYDASIHHGDRQVGRFLDTLRRLRLMRNTVILITSDHGDEFFEHGNCDHVRFLYREVINVPYILYVPGLTPKGSRVESLVPASISIPRTLLDIVGASHGMPGVTLEPTLRGHPQRFDAVYSETDSVAGRLGSRGETIAITTPRYKLVEYTEEGSDEAYDVRTDPYEQLLLPPDHDAYRQRSTLRSWHTAMAPAPVPSRRIATATVPGDAPTAEQRQRNSAAAAAQGARAGTAERRAANAAGTYASEADPDVEDEADTGYQVLPDELAEHLKALGYVE
ncbi:MAG: sulfatase [Candidatus Binatia bacterium]